MALNVLAGLASVDDTGIWKNIHMFKENPTNEAQPMSWRKEMSEIINIDGRPRSISERNFSDSVLIELNPRQHHLIQGTDCFLVLFKATQIALIPSWAWR